MDIYIKSTYFYLRMSFSFGLGKYTDLERFQFSNNIHDLLHIYMSLQSKIYILYNTETLINYSYRVNKTNE